MSGAGASILQPNGSGIRVAIVAASWHEQVMAGLIAGATGACTAAGAAASLIRVAGSFELPVVAKACALSERFDAVVALGVVIRGGTPHFDFVCDAATSGLKQVALDHLIPVGFGLLTCDNEAQAIDRAGLPGSKEDKGAEATWAAINTAITLRDLSD
ncbi:MAG: 6,7-dimethyl-8-ribityllumazine synthase [Candidatus Nanopelagicales bacterium]|nr:6,7-dimethyl-8-ribityllumazine synthase [Candidatus Nanopelagicales bacterium]